VAQVAEAALARTFAHLGRLQSDPGGLPAAEASHQASLCHAVSKTVQSRQVKYLNNIVGEDHRAIKRRTRPMMGFKDFRCARITLSGTETKHMIRKGEMKTDGVARTATEQFYSMVIQGIRTMTQLYCLADLIATQSRRLRNSGFRMP
jgi:transposase-like protein